MRKRCGNCGHWKHEWCSVCKKSKQADQDACRFHVTTAELKRRAKRRAM